MENNGTIEDGPSVQVTNVKHADGDEPEPEVTYPGSAELLDELEVGFDDDTSDSSRTPVLTSASLGTVAKEDERDALKRLAGGDSTNLYVEWSLDENALNEIQGDEVTFDVVVNLFSRSPSSSTTTEAATTLDPVRRRRRRHHSGPGRLPTRSPSWSTRPTSRSWAPAPARSWSRSGAPVTGSTSRQAASPSAA